MNQLLLVQDEAPKEIKVASGLIAGEGLTGVVTAVLQVLGIDRAWLVGLFG